MSFYLRPPKGLANLHSLEKTVVQRLKCYEYLNSDNIVEIIPEMECLMEDSIMDRLGHYLLRFTALKSTSFFHIFPHNEVKLLDIRLSCYETSDLKEFIKKLKKQAKISLETTEACSQIKEFCDALYKICTQMLNREYFEHIEHESVSCDKCRTLIIKVPFHFCPEVLASRTVNITRGFLQISPHQWKKLILSLYQNYLLLVLKVMRTVDGVHRALDDERISDVIEMTKTLFFKNVALVEKGSFNLQNFDDEAKLFPLCMNHLHEVLKRNNRLGHNDRFDFSLFLKSIGMSMTDSMTFWQEAYSKQHATCSKCTHSWQNSEKRYIYGIRHLYGLEGARKDYCCRSCYQIESSSLSANQDGGCPFKHFNDCSLTTALKRHLPAYSSEEIEVIIHEREESPRRACMSHMKNQLQSMKKSVPDKGMEYLNPADYYLLVKRLTSLETNG